MTKPYMQKKRVMQIALCVFQCNQKQLAARNGYKEDLGEAKNVEMPLRSKLQKCHLMLKW